MSTSRRDFLHAAGVLSAGALALHHGRLLTELGAAASQAPPQDRLAAARAQHAAAAIQVTRLAANVVLLAGPGGNVVVLHGPDGKVVVDTFVRPAWDKLRTALDAIEGGPVRTVIDTHWHFDHSDNNGPLRAAGAAVVAHDNTRRRLTETHEILGMRIEPVDAGALPTETFAGTKTLAAGAESILLTHVPPAHTDGDILVHLTRANVLHMGDLFFNGGYPFIDTVTGGTINGLIASAALALKMTNAETRIVPGHGPVGDRAALDGYRRMLTAVRDRVRTEKASGRSLADVQAAKPTAEFDAVWGRSFMRPDDFVALVYNTL